ncbi:hypothetical protein BG005_005886, partial [Podila minutissima]
HFAPQQQQPQQQGPFDYIMHPDKGGWTLRNAWEEYHGPVVCAHAESHKTWSESHKKQYNCRTKLIESIKAKALRDVRTIDSILDSKDYTGMSINAVKELLMAEYSEAAMTKA